MEKDMGIIRVPQSPHERLLGRAYVPSQQFEGIYVPKRALESGTCFAELDMPYVPKRVGGYK